MSRTNISFERRSLWLDVPLAEMGHPPLFPRVKPFENVTLGLSVETFEMVPGGRLPSRLWETGKREAFSKAAPPPCFPQPFRRLGSTFFAACTVGLAAARGLSRRCASS